MGKEESVKKRNKVRRNCLYIMAVTASVTAGGWGRATQKSTKAQSGRKPICKQSRPACSASCSSTRTCAHEGRQIISLDKSSTRKRNTTDVVSCTTEESSIGWRNLNMFKKKSGAEAGVDAGAGAAAAARACALVAATSLCGSMTALSTQHAIAAEYDILGTATPAEGSYILDDAKVLSKASESVLKKSLSSLETDTGYHIDIVTTRKLTFSADAYEFADKTIEKWYPTKELGDKKALLLLVTGSKEGAVVGGPSFIKGAGPIGDSIAGESIPFYGDKELWNEAILSSAKRLDVVLRGGDDPGPPKGDAGKAGRSYKTKEETDAKKTNFSAAVIGLLVISVVAPMLQYFAYVKDD